MKKCANNFKKKIRKLFQTKIDSSIPKDYKLRKSAGSFNDKYIECVSVSDEKLTVKEYLENTRPYLQDKIDNRKTFGE